MHFLLTYSKYLITVIKLPMPLITVHTVSIKYHVEPITKLVTEAVSLQLLQQ